MTKIQNNKPVYDLEERTFQFARAVRVISIWDLGFIWNLILGI
jgi:hypothetical protein